MHLLNRRLHCAAWLAILLLAGCATPMPRMPAAPTAEPAFIRDSAVDFPQAISIANLVSHLSLGTVRDGINLIYRLTDLPEAVFDVFIYPAGDIPTRVALGIGQQDFLTSLRLPDLDGEAVPLEVIAREPFDVVITDGRKLPGIKTRIEMPGSGAPTELVSQGYLFYRQFYFIKVRITSDAADEVQLERLGTLAVRELIPKIDIRSHGRCGRLMPMRDASQVTPIASQLSVTGTELYVRDPDDVEASMAQVQLARDKGMACYGSRDFPPLADGYSRRTMQYQADDWNRDPR